MRPVMQKEQPSLQPTWEERHSVARSPSGIITASTPVLETHKVGKRYFLVPSVDTCTCNGSKPPTWYVSASFSRAALLRLVMSAISLTCLAYIQLAI